MTKSWPGYLPVLVPAIVKHSAVVEENIDSVTSSILGSNKIFAIMEDALV